MTASTEIRSSGAQDIAIFFAVSEFLLLPRASIGGNFGDLRVSLNLPSTELLVLLDKTVSVEYLALYGNLVHNFYWIDIHNCCHCTHQFIVEDCH